MENVFTKADILKIIAELESYVERNEKAQIEVGINDKRKGKIEAYNFIISRIKNMAYWKGIKLL